MGVIRFEYATSYGCPVLARFLTTEMRGLCMPVYLQ